MQKKRINIQAGLTPDKKVFEAAVYCEDELDTADVVAAMKEILSQCQKALEKEKSVEKLKLV